MPSVASLIEGWWPLPAWATTAVVLLVTLYAALHRLSAVPTDPREPPIITSRVPFLGPLFGMVLQGGYYVKSIGLANSDKPIFTLPVPGSRIYIVTEPTLAAAVQRASKTLSFNPLIPEATKRVLGMDRTSFELTRINPDPEPGQPNGLLVDMHDTVYAELGPGEALDRLSLDGSRELAARLADYADGMRGRVGEGARPGGGGGGGGGDVVDLLVWVRHFVTVGTAEFLFGPRNPIAEEPELEAAFWDFVHGLGLLLTNVLPSVTAPRAHRARERFAAAHLAYLRAGRHLGEGGNGPRGAASIVRKRIEVAQRHGMPMEGIARSDFSFLFAGIINTATTTFWALLHIYARPALLAAVREEVEAHALAKGGGGGGEGEGGEEEGEGGGEEEGGESADGEPCRRRRRRRQVSLEAVRTSCPTLLAVFRECLRVGSDNFSTRLVKEDTLLADRWLLRKGAVVQISGGVMHASTSLWGDDAAGFDPARFLGRRSQQQQQHPASFRGFGGGRTLCPGRHFATVEIMALVACVVLAFDMEAVEPGAAIVVPRKDDRVLPIHVLEPAAKDVVRVRVKLRPGEDGMPAEVVP